MIDKKDLARELLTRRVFRANPNFLDYIRYCSPNFKVSAFCQTVCPALDNFIDRVYAGKRPVLILQAPPQHGKSEMVSRRLPAYLFGRFPSVRIGTASYSSELAHNMAQDVRRNLASPEHQNLFPVPQVKRKFALDRMGDFTAPGGSGSYIGVGVGSGLTGRPVDIGIIDDPIKDQQEALSEVTKLGHKNWYESVFITRLSENSGQIIMATSWAEDDLPALIAQMYAGSDRLTVLRFPALNYPDETGFNSDLPIGALVPELKSEQFLREQKSIMSDFWWSALYQQSPRSIGGNVFKESGVHYYYPKDLPKKFDIVIDSWDCSFKDTDGSDFVVGQKWGKAGANAYLLTQIRGRMGFTATAEAVVRLRNTEPVSREILIEDKANGPAVIDFLKKAVFGLIPVEPDGSKLARAHAVTSVWEAGNVWLPHFSLFDWVVALVNELTIFNSGANDDQVDALTQALRRLFPLFGRINISPGALARVKGIIK